MKILVVDDDPDIRNALEVILGALGHEVTLAEDGEKGWLAFSRNEFQAVITDWVMPGIEGPDLCQMIRGQSRERYTYVIMLTALQGRSKYIEALDSGADDFISKPLDADELAARLRVAQRWLRVHEHVTQLEGLLSICSYCKKIRDDAGAWQQLDGYVARRTGVQFSHGICPECLQRELARHQAKR